MIRNEVQVSDEADSRAQSSALMLRAEAVPILGDEVELQTLWLSLARRPWRSLAVMAASEGMSTVGTASSLARIAWWYTGQPSCVFDMRHLSLRVLGHQLREMSTQMQGGERVFVALGSLSENPTAAPIAMAADGVVLCVELGKASIKSAKRTIAAIGRDRFLGTILVSPSPTEELDARSRNGPC